MNLWPVQAAALQDIHDHRGLFGPIGVGQGKALVSLLAPMVLDCDRPLLLVPAQLREQTNLHVLPEMSKHWQLHKNLRVIGYSELSLAKNAEMLETIKPDLIIADEVHFLKNRTSGRTKRMIRYMGDNEDTTFIGLSGTITNRSFMDYWHILLWCLKMGAPAPLKWNEANAWSEALEYDPRYVKPWHLGAFSTFAAEGENHREGYRRRLTHTPGVVATRADKLGTALRVVERPLELENKCAVMLHYLEEKWVAPNGDEISEPIEKWRYGRQLSAGFWYEWDPPPPTPWLEARKEWKRHVRRVIQYGRQKLDTELQVFNACKRSYESGHVHDAGVDEWIEWVNVRGDYEPDVVPRWVSDFMLDDAASWLHKNNGIAWVEHTTVGERLAELARVPYFGPGANASRDILKASGPIVASVRAHGEGKNLQQWSKNLVVSAPTAGKTWEQMLGRTHRHGQQADEVTVEVYLHTGALRQGFTRAIGDAVYQQQTLGSPQRLLYCDLILLRESQTISELRQTAVRP